MFVTEAYGQETAPAAESGYGAEGGAAPADAAYAGTEVPGEGGGAAFPPFDTSTFPSQILWLAITFGIFYIFLKKVIVPRLGAILDVRETRIAQDIEQATKMKADADAAVAAYEQELAEARGNANTIGQQARDNAKAEAETKRKSIEADLEQKLADAEARVAKIKEAAMQDVGSIAEETASAIVSALGGNSAKGDVSAAVKSVRS
ncbi:MAG: F0F1 ATP synthase subunit B [Mesorhizobium sp.]|nr:F0F1 ATP synthase subunit B [Mesorhizobium sp.]MBL8577376.1 F0F1 ATP synthase subunit B [Mesorhizobium sp.]